MNMELIYPVITLYQPWATWIMRRWKIIETRTHDKFRSLNGKTILIHAGQRTDSSDAVIRNPYLTRDQILWNPDEVINGAILGSAKVKQADWISYELSELKNASIAALIDCVETFRFGLWLTDISRFSEPIPEKGEMGIWYYDLEKKQKVKKPSSQLKVF